MKILTCFKAIPDLERLRETAWVPDSRNNIDMSLLRPSLNCFDESALALSIRYSQEANAAGKETRLLAMTVGDASADHYLRLLLSLTFESATRVQCDMDLRFRPELVSAIIAAFAVRSGCTVVMAGQQCTDGNNEKTPLLTAERLGWRCVTQVTDIHPTREGLMVSSVTDEGLLTQTIIEPCVLSVGNAALSFLPAPTLKNKLTAGKRPVNVLSVEDLGISSGEPDLSAGVSLVGMKRISQRRATEEIKGDLAAEKADKLFQVYLRKVLSR